MFVHDGVDGKRDERQSAKHAPPVGLGLSNRNRTGRLFGEKRHALSASTRAVAAIVREAAGAQLRLEDLSLEFLRKHIPDADEGAKAALSAETAVAAREHTGGTAPKEVLRQIAKRRKALGAV